MEKLTKEEVLHVANLARLELTDDEIDEYAIKLKEQFQKVCDETIGIEKQLLTSNGIEPDDEKSKIKLIGISIINK